MRILILIIVLMGCSLASTKLSPPVESNFQPELFLGEWYEIARLPNWFEKNLIRVTATYIAKNENSLRVINKGFDSKKKKWKEAKAIAKYAKEPSIGHLRVSFFRPFYTDYFVLEVGENYQYALIGGNSPDYLWILARQKTLDSTITDALLKKAEQLGYQVENIEFIEQD